MRIDNLSYYNNYNYPVQKQTFRGQVGPVSDVANIIKCNGNTQFFRGDLIWSKIAAFLDKHFAKADKVTFINHACSSGEEPYSVVMKLITDLGDRAKKFFPIIAKDLSPNNIQRAEDGRLLADYYEKRMIEEMTNKQPEKFVELVPLGNASKSSSTQGHLVITKYKLKNNIEFSVGNALEDIKNIPEKNTVLFLRNFWQYLKPQERENLMSEISKKFKDDSSVLFIGVADVDNSNITYLLEKYGFVETEFPYAYVKSNKPSLYSKYFNPQNEVHLT